MLAESGADTGQDLQDNQRKTIDEAIADCVRNISFHTRSSLMEILAAFVLISLVLFMMLQLARLQGTENDNKHTELLAKLKELQDYADSEAKEYQASLKYVTFLQNKKNPKAEDTKDLQHWKDNVAEQLKNVQSARTAVASGTKELADYRGKPIVSDTMLYGVGAFLVVILGIIASTYRIHLREISKNEQYKLAFLRIRIAANNATTPGFDGEVRTALTRNPFDVYPEDLSFSRRRKMESPIPGHPTTELATSILNRILDEVEIVFQPKKKGS